MRERFAFDLEFSFHQNHYHLLLLLGDVLVVLQSEYMALHGEVRHRNSYLPEVSLDSRASASQIIIAPVASPDSGCTLVFFFFFLLYCVCFSLASQALLPRFSSSLPTAHGGFGFVQKARMLLSSEQCLQPRRMIFPLAHVQAASTDSRILIHQG